MSTRFYNLIFGAALVLGAATTASAQAALTTTTPTFEAGAGYQFLRVPDLNFPVGFNVDGVRHFGSLGLVGELGWSRHSDSDLGFDFSTNMWNYGVGPRWTGFRPGSLWPFAQVLIGGVSARSSIDVAGVDESETESSFMIQPGVGATFLAGDGWGIYGQVDYRRTFFDQADDDDSSINNHFRVVIGARLILD